MTAVAVCPPTIFSARSDAVECRFLLNDAVAEIERLRREIAGLEASRHGLTAPPACLASRSMDSVIIDLSKASSARRAYAVAPLGEVKIAPMAAHPPPPLPPQRIVGVVTNLATLLDVLI